MDNAECPIAVFNCIDDNAEGYDVGDLLEGNILLL